MIDHIPHNEDAERAILGNVLADPDTLAVAVERRVTAADFYHPDYSRVFAGMLALHRRGVPVDLVSIRQQMGADLDAELYGHLVDLASGYGVYSHHAYYCDAVLKASQRRQLASIGRALVADACDLEQDDPLGLAQARLSALDEGTAAVETRHIGEVAAAAVDRIEARRQARAHGKPWRPVVTFGLYDLDARLLIGDQDLIIVGARPSAGKTAFGLQVALHASQSAPVCFFSLEMHEEQIVARALSSLTGISARRQEEGDVTADEVRQLSSAYQTLAQRHVRIDARAALTVAEMTTAARRHKRKHGLGLVVIDHLSRIGMGNARSRYEGMTSISGDLAKMRRELGVPVLALAQLRRPDGGDEEKRPTMADLRDSGAVEQDADGILLIHRPQRDGALTNADIAVPKWRMGDAGFVVPLQYDGPRTRFRCPEWGGV